MPSTTWTAGNGSFFTAGDWNNGVPGVGVDGTIDGTITAPLTITYAGTDTANSLSMAFATLSMTSGSLTLAQASGLSGFTQSAGLIDFQNGGLNTAVSGFSGKVTQSKGASIRVDAGTLSLTGGGSFAGALSGAGAVALSGATTYTFKKGAKVTTGALSVSGTGTTLALGAALSFAGRFSAGAGTTVSLGKSTLTLGGSASLGDFTSGSGSLDITGQTSVGSWTLGGTATVVNNGTLTQTFEITLGNGSGAVTIDNASGHAYDIVFDQGDTRAIDSDGSAVINNGGLFEKTAGTGTDRIDARFIDSYAGKNGTVSVSTGTLYFTVADQFAGTITGTNNGTVLLGGGVQQTLDAGAIVSVPTLDIVDTGTTLDVLGPLGITRVLNQNGGTAILLGANALTLAAGSAVGVAGFVSGSGTIAAAGALFLNNGAQIGGTETVLNTGSIAVTFQTVLGSNAGTVLLQNQAGAIVNVVFDQGDQQTLLNGGGGAFSNAGLFEKTVGNGTNRIDVRFTQTSTGTTDIAGGSVYLVGTTDLAGSVIGTNDGTMLLGGGVQDTLEAGVVISLPTLDIVDGGTVVNVLGPLTIANVLNQNGGTTLSIGSHKLTLATTSVVNSNGFVTGSGTIAAQGVLALNSGFQLGGSETLLNTGSIVETFQITLGSNTGAVRLQNQAGAIFNIAFDQGDQIALQNGGGGAFDNAGLFEKTAGTGVDRIDTAFTDETTGTVDVQTGTVYFRGAADIKGSVTGAGGVWFGGATQQTLDAGAIITSGAFAVVDGGTDLLLNTSLTYAGVFSENGGTALTLAGTTLTLAAGATANLNGFVGGTGKLLNHGVLNDVGFNLGNTATLENTGTITQTFQLALGNSTGATLLQNDAGAVYDITFDQGDQQAITADGNAVIANSGLFEKTAGVGVARIDAKFNQTSTGAISVDASGTLYFIGGGSLAGTIEGSGAVWLGGGNTWSLAAGLSLPVSVLAIVDSGTTVALGANVTYAGTLDQNGGTTLNLGANKLTLTGVGNLAGLVTGAGGTLLLKSGTTAITNGDTIGGTATIEVQGLAAQSANNTIGDSAASAAVLRVDGGSTYDFTGNAEMFRNGNASVNNIGTLEKTGGTGNSQVDPNVTNTGSILATVGSLTFTGTVTNDAAATARLGAALVFTGALAEDTGTHGSVTVAQGGTATFDGFVDAGQTIDFADSTGFVNLTSQNIFHGTIAGFVAGDTIDVAGLAQTTTNSFSGGVLTLANATQSVSIAFAGSFTLGSFNIISDGHGGTFITDPPASRALFVPSPHIG